MSRASLGLLCASLFVGSALGQTNEYYLADGGSLKISVVQNGAVVRSWTARDDQMPIAVMDTVRTYGEYGSDFGSEYDLDGTWTGVDYPHNGEPNVSQNTDGTTDGIQYNFLCAWNDGAVWRFDLDWKNPERLFDVASPTGITYDSSTGHLWVVSYSSKTVIEYDMDGNELSSFTYPNTWMGALAYDASDDTLWANEFNTGRLYQFSKDGQTLQDITVGEVAGYVWGGEFQAGGGAGCSYTIKKSKSKQGCETCPAKGDDYVVRTECENNNDCKKKLKATIACPRGGNGVCKVKGKKPECK